MGLLTQYEEKDPEFHLYFIEGFHQEEPRRCTTLKRVSFGAASKMDSLLVRIHPPCSGELYGVEEREIHSLLLSAFFAGQSFFPVERWPMQVRIYLPLIADPELRDHIDVAETRNMALGEIRNVPEGRYIRRGGYSGESNPVQK